MSDTLSMRERYEAAMVLGGIGDSIGFHAGAWEFLKSGESIFLDMQRITGGRGVLALELRGPEWKVSDDTVMHIATAEGLVLGRNGKQLFLDIAKRYYVCSGDMAGRAPGSTTMASIALLGKDGAGWDKIPFDPRSGGCGAAMRSMCIGLRFHLPESLRQLVECAIESGRTTHHNGVGYLGSVASAAFASFAVQGLPIKSWGFRLLNDVIPVCKTYVSSFKRRSPKENVASMDFFVTRWQEYLKLRQIDSAGGGAGPLFPEVWEIKERDAFYASLSFNGWGGASGHDAPMIAYDALMWAGNSYEKMCMASMIHGGDSDSTGTIAGSLWGAMFGMRGVPECHTRDLEYRDRMADLGRRLHDMFYAVPPSIPAPSASSSSPRTRSEKRTCIIV